MTATDLPERGSVVGPPNLSEGFSDTFTSRFIVTAGRKAASKSLRR
jgi:hypothetical protein